MKDSTTRCLRALRGHGWVSGNLLFQAAGTRYGGRIHELRHDYGLTIEKRPVRGSHVPEYRLVEEPVQLTLLEAAS